MKSSTSINLQLCASFNEFRLTLSLIIRFIFLIMMMILKQGLELKLTKIMIENCVVIHQIYYRHTKQDLHNS